MLAKACDATHCLLIAGAAAGVNREAIIGPPLIRIKLFYLFQLIGKTEMFNCEARAPKRASGRFGGSPCCLATPETHWRERRNGMVDRPADRRSDARL